MPRPHKGGEMPGGFSRRHPQGGGERSGKGGDILFARAGRKNPLVLQNFPTDQFSQEIPMPVPIQLAGTLLAQGAIFLPF